MVYFSKKLFKKAFFQRLGIEEYHTHNYVIVTDRHFASVAPSASSHNSPQVVRDAGRLP